MKKTFRKPSVKKSISSRTTGRVTREINKATNPLYGKKGIGVVSNPKKAIYNKGYNKTTIGAGGIITFVVLLVIAFFIGILLAL